MNNCDLAFCGTIPGNKHGYVVAYIGTSLMLVEQLKERDSLRAERELLQTNIAQLARSAH